VSLGRPSGKQTSSSDVIHIISPPRLHVDYRGSWRLSAAAAAASAGFGRAASLRPLHVPRSGRGTGSTVARDVKKHVLFASEIFHEIFQYFCVLFETFFKKSSNKS